MGGGESGARDSGEHAVTKRDLIRMRAAFLAGVNAAFDVLEATSVERVQIRPPTQPDGEYTDLDRKRAEAIAKRHGIG